MNWSSRSAEPWSPLNSPCLTGSNSQGNLPRGSHALVGQEVHTGYPSSRTDQEWNVHWLKYHATVRMNQLQRSTPMWALSGRGRPSRKTHSLVPVYRHRHSLTRQVQILYPKPLGPGGSGIQNVLNAESYQQRLFHLM